MYWDTINVTFRIRREGERREKVREEKEVERRERLRGERG